MVPLNSRIHTAPRRGAPYLFAASYRSSPSATSAPAQALSNEAFARRRVGLLLRFEAAPEPEQRARIADVLLQIGAEHAFGLGVPRACEQARRPAARARESANRAARCRPSRSSAATALVKAAIAPAVSPFASAIRAVRSATATASIRRPRFGAPTIASLGIFGGTLPEAPASSASASAVLPVPGERRAAREVIQRGLHRSRRRRRLRLPSIGPTVPKRSATASSCGANGSIISHLIGDRIRRAPRCAARRRAPARSCRQTSRPPTRTAGCGRNTSSGRCPPAPVALKYFSSTARGVGVALGRLRVLAGADLDVRRHVDQMAGAGHQRLEPRRPAATARSGVFDASTA